MHRLTDPFHVFVRHRVLIGQMARREITQPYAGQLLSRVWPLIHPIFLAAIYTIVFTFIFDARGGGTLDRDGSYSVFLLSGLVPWLGFIEVFANANRIIIGNANLVQQVIFPVEALPLSTTLASLFKTVLGLAFVLIVAIVQDGADLGLVLIAPAFAIHILWIIGSALFLAAVGTFVRDLKDIIQLFAVVSIYVLPIIYPADPPPLLAPFVQINPFSPLIVVYQDAFFDRAIVHPLHWLIAAAFAVVTFYVGHSVFDRLKSSFTSVL